MQMNHAEPKNNTHFNTTIHSCSKMEARLSALESAYKRPSVQGHTTSQPNTLFQKSGFSTNSHHRQGDKYMFQHFLRSGDDYGQKSLSSTDSRSQTILIPNSTQEFVEGVIPDYSPLRKIAKVSQIATESLELLVDKGGADVGWVAETGRRDETEAPELAKITIPTFEMYARPRASQKLLDDACVNIEQWLIQKIAMQMGIMETQAFVNGDGKNKPRGYLTHPTTDLGTPEWGKIEKMSSFSEGKIEDTDVLVEVFHSMKPEYLEGAHWIMSRATLAMVRKMKDKDGHYVWLPHVSQESSSTLLGYPVIICDAMPNPSKESLSIAFGNFKQAYQIVERQDIQLLRDPYSAKPYVEFYATKRIGGDVINFDAIKLIQF